jgi:UDP-N-acetylmuramate dehydrogenase
MLRFLEKNHEIGHYSGYRTIVHAEYFYELTSEDDLSRLHEAYIFAKVQGLPFLIISGGMNILFAKEYFSWVVIKNSIEWWKYSVEDKILYARSNDSIWDIAEILARDYNQPLWHRFIGLPGSLGWAVYGNAGCFGLDTENNFVRATIYDMQTWVIQEFSKDEMWFAYRHSMMKEHREYFLISAEFDLSRKIERYHSDVDNIDFRDNKQPKGNSCGSFWKNPKFPHEGGMPVGQGGSVSAWSLIESVGLKWYRHGWARWSELHANFLLSDGESCKTTDLIELVEMTRKKVQEEKWIALVNEVQIIS